MAPIAPSVELADILKWHQETFIVIYATKFLEMSALLFLRLQSTKFLGGAACKRAVNATAARSLQQSNSQVTCILIHSQ
ncbi:hypothetical protein NADE_008451 [Nannochloris sp. 'desiccata']|nr:hypothetical protein NADE_008451 [Chlorella desiccata (nom. nud.)]